jgi:hypothetical protein
MQCQMQMMTAMMSKMQTSIDKISPDQGTVAAPAPPHINGRDFITPPPRTSTMLSPIPEGSTPLPTPHSSQQPPFPPNLGRFAPEQLPLPPYTQGVRQNAPVTTYTEPITSTTSAPPSFHQITQYTNPSTHPQFYQQADQFDQSSM